MAGQLYFSLIDTDQLRCMDMRGTSPAAVPSYQRYVLTNHAYWQSRVVLQPLQNTSE